MASLLTTFRVEILTDDEWFRLRDVRLYALSESPHAFLSSFDREVTYQKRKWQAEFARGEWIVMVTRNQTVGLLGATRESAASLSECYLEYMWVVPDFRRSGVASLLLKTALDYLRSSGVITILLWVLDGNERARVLYERFGFRSTNERQPLTADPARSEELMKLILH